MLNKINGLFIVFMTSVMALTSCAKIKESIRRDVFITTPIATLTVPVISNITDEIELGNFNASGDLNALIKAQAPDFSIEDVETIKIRSFKIELSDADTLNNLANFEILRTQLNADGRTFVTLATKTENPDTQASTILLPIVNGGTELKGYFSSANLKYTIFGILRRPTTKTLTVKITVQYTVTLSM